MTEKGRVVHYTIVYPNGLREKLKVQIKWDIRPDPENLYEIIYNFLKDMEIDYKYFYVSYSEKDDEVK